jgi:hypothetical protein
MAAPFGIIGHAAAGPGEALEPADAGGGFVFLSAQCDAHVPQGLPASEGTRFGVPTEAKVASATIFRAGESA